ncbi:hypothetical protein NFI96_030514, partial [Prochilodus magdalenae]
GVYQQCTSLNSDGDAICQELAVKNPATGSFSCQKSYTATLLLSETQERSYDEYVCHESCISCGFLWLSTCCDNVCGDVNSVGSAQIDTYWCSANGKVPEFSGYLFGGLYGPSVQNPVTKSRSCPPNFFALKFLSNGMMICLSSDYETATRFSVPFGGFFSCQSNNFPAGNQPRCPPQFSQHLAAISDGCQVLYCVQSGIFTGGELLPIHLPPFTRPPVISTASTSTVVVMTEGNRTWVRVKDTKTWKPANPGDINKMSSSDAVDVLMALVVVVIVGVVIMEEIQSPSSLFRPDGSRDKGSPEEPDTDLAPFVLDDGVQWVTIIIHNGQLFVQCPPLCHLHHRSFAAVMGSTSLSLLGLFAFICTCELHPLSRSSNGLPECHKNSNLPALEVLPGGGWDNLRNLDMGRVMNISFSQCQTTEDGVYLIPDEVFVIPQKVSRVEMNSEIISSWLEQKSSTSRSINGDGSFFSVLNSKFSSENQRMKTHQVKDNSVTSYVQVRDHLYTVQAYPDFTLDTRFTSQAKEIADAIGNNQTRLAEYLSEKMVLDYGTHVITSVDAGATLVQEDYLKSSYVSNMQSSQSSFSASAGANFFEKVKFDIGGKTTQETSEMRNYLGNITYSITLSHGGALFYPGITLEKWQESTLNNLVAIDRGGLPLHYFLNPSMFPDLPVPTVNKLALSVQQAIERYYKINTRPGCVKPDSKNFNFQANVDDDSCEGPSTNLSFGGVYQQCTSLMDGDAICQDLAVKNPATGSFSCQQSYTATLLLSETQERSYDKYECQKSCRKCGFLWLSTCCDNVCGNVYSVQSARIDTYWCATNGVTPQSSGYLFGGLYGPLIQNPITKARSCPSNFFTQKFLSSGMMICLSNDYETATKFSVPFGGFFSCQSTNLLAESQSRCPPQFSQQLAAISDGCQVLYCVHSSVFTKNELLPIHLPPFTRPPLISMLATNTVAVMTQGDRTWMRVKDTKMWRLANPEDISKMSRILEASPQSGGKNVGVTFGVLA